MRHEISLEDVDDAVHSHTPDKEISLNAEGVARAIAWGKELNEILKKRYVDAFKIYVAPHKRTRETAELIAASIDAVPCRIIIDNLLAKQNTGILSMKNRDRIDRQRFLWGELDYRYPEGETGWDVLRRLMQFLINRSLERLESKKNGRREVSLIITHGLQKRLFETAMLTIRKVLATQDLEEVTKEEIRKTFLSLPKPANGEITRYKKRGSGYARKGNLKQPPPKRELINEAGNDNEKILEKEAA